jgi:hypothetical protein
MRLEATVGALVCDCLCFGFVAGWKFAMNPGSYLFGEIKLNEVYGSTADNVIHTEVFQRCNLDKVYTLLRALDHDLGCELENAILARMCKVADSAFKAGWDCCHNPAKLIFEMAGDD